MIKYRFGDFDVALWPSEVIGLVILAAGVWLFWRANANRRNPLDLSEMFVWPGTKHTSMAMVLAFWVALICMWVIIDAELKGKLDWPTFGTFMAIGFGGKGLTEFINAWRAKNVPPPVQPPAP